MKKTREEMIKKLCKLADIASRYDGEKGERACDKVWNLACDWNHEHYGKDEIDVHEIWNDDYTENIGIGVEDAVFYW